jgi:hypothetical protein
MKTKWSDNELDNSLYEEIIKRDTDKKRLKN